MSTVDEGATTSIKEVPLGNPEELVKNPVVLKEAQEQMSTLDVHVCGKCYSAFYFLEEFKEHKDISNCTGKSPLRDGNESDAQIWAFFLWKCSSSRDGTAADNSCKFYQQWCQMEEAQRNAWISAGSTVHRLSKFALAKVDDRDYAPSGEDRDEVIMETLDLQECVPPGKRIARRIEKDGADLLEAEEFVVEKILAKRFNPRRKQYEYLLKWEDYPHEQNTWQPLHNMVTCKQLLEAFENELAIQKELKDMERESVCNSQERVPPEERLARRTEKDGANPSEPGEFIVEKILNRRFNYLRWQYEYLLKWEGYPHSQITWEPVQNMDETCKKLLDAFLNQLARQNELNALRAQQHPIQDTERESVCNLQERVPPEERLARRTEKNFADPSEPREFVVEKILSKRYNPRLKRCEYLLKWEGYPHLHVTWEPVDNMQETCTKLLDAFEDQLVRQEKLRALRARQHPVQVMERESVCNLPFVPPEERLARRTERNGADPLKPEEFVVEKILSMRYNLRRQQNEYLLKWEGYPNEHNTWEPLAYVEGTCTQLLEAFETELARPYELNALRPQQNPIQDMETESVCNLQELVPPEERLARRTEKDFADPSEPGEFVVEKILSWRFSTRLQQREYLLKWEGYPHSQITWEPQDNLCETCTKLEDPFEDQIFRQRKLRALRAQQRPVQDMERESIRNAQARVPPEERIARRTKKDDADPLAGEFVVEKILAKRFNPRRRQYEYLLKWEYFPLDQNTWEPLVNMATCKQLLDVFENQLVRQKELKALRAQQEQAQDMDRESVRNAQARVPPEERIARRTKKDDADPLAGEFVVEKILAKRFNPRRRQYEYLLKWEYYPLDQNTWEPLVNMATCKQLLDVFENQLVRQKELKALRAQQEQAQVKQIGTPVPQVCPRDINETPPGQALETPLQPKRRRTFDQDTVTGPSLPRIEDHLRETLTPSTATE